MRFSPYRRGFLVAVLIVLIPHARAQDASIDELLEKLPPPEMLAKPAGTAALEENDPAAKDPLVKDVMLALGSKNFPKALNLSRQLIARYPKSAGAYCMNASICSALGQNGEASFCLRKAIDLRPDLVLPHFLLGNMEISQRHYGAALPHFQKAAELDPKNPIVWSFLSQCAEKDGKSQKALDYAKRATTASPAFVGGWCQLARMEDVLGHTDEALSALSRAAELAPDNAQLLTTAGYSYVREDRLMEAIPLLRRAAEIEPDDALVQAQLGYCLLVTKKLDEAIPYLTRATRLNPQYPEAWEHLASVYQDQGRHRDAINAFKRATQLVPKRLNSWENLAREYRAVGELASATRAEARARALGSQTFPVEEKR